MQLTAFNIVVILALVLSVIGIIKPAWPLVPVAVILICAALFIGR